jgi:hypothetical protein
MGKTGQSQPLLNGSELSSLNSQLQNTLAQLAKAREYARDLACDPWEFAVEIDRLVTLGASTSDLRWLAKKGYIEHAREMTRPEDPARRFKPSNNLAFTKESCFILAETVCLPPENKDACLDAATNATTDVAPNPAVPASNPHWDSEDRILYVGHQVVKEFRVRSPNQEAILSAFEEEGWPHYVDDPLSPVADQNPKHRLRDTIKCLNTNQRNPLIRFRGDGTGERVRWERIE